MANGLISETNQIEILKGRLRSLEQEHGEAIERIEAKLRELEAYVVTIDRALDRGFKVVRY